MKVRHLRLGREMKLGNALTFMANERVPIEDAVAGDIIGIHNHGQLQIGDTLTEGEALGFKGIPYFAPELFRIARPRDPFKAKQLQKGLQELGEEGAIQVFERVRRQYAAAGRGRPTAVRGGRRIVCRANTRSTRSTTPPTSHTARWLTFPDEATRQELRAASTRPRWRRTWTTTRSIWRPTNTTCRSTMERWPKVGFHATREHGQRLAQG